VDAGYIFIALMVLGIFIGHLIWQWWRENEWKRQWRKRRRETLDD
jgi:hypothetical protein